MGQILLRPATCAKQYFDNAVKADANGTLELIPSTAGDSIELYGFAAGNPRLKIKEFPMVYQLNQLSKFIRQISHCVLHAKRILRSRRYSKDVNISFCPDQCSLQHA